MAAQRVKVQWKCQIGWPEQILKLLCLNFGNVKCGNIPQPKQRRKRCNSLRIGRPSAGKIRLCWCFGTSYCWVGWRRNIPYMRLKWGGGETQCLSGRGQPMLTHDAPITGLPASVPPALSGHCAALVLKILITTPIASSSKQSMTILIMISQSSGLTRYSTGLLSRLR